MDEFIFETQARRVGVPSEHIKLLIEKKLHLQVPDGTPLKRMDFEKLLTSLNPPAPAPQTVTPLPEAIQTEKQVVYVYAQNPGTPPAVLGVVPVAALPPEEERRRKKKTSFDISRLLYVLIVAACVFVLYLVVSVPTSSGAPLVPIPWAESIKCEDGVDTSIHLVVNPDGKIGDVPVILPANTPLLGSKKICIYFNAADMTTLLIQRVSLPDSTGAVKPYTGSEVLANKIVRATAKKIGADGAWINDWYYQVLTVLNPEKFKTVGEYSYLILPGYDEPKATIDPTATALVIPATPPENPDVAATPTVEILTPTDVPTPSPMPTDTPPPTPVPRPTLQSAVEWGRSAVATQMVIWGSTPLPTAASTSDGPIPVTLEYFLSSLIRGNACSPLSADYGNRWPPMDNTITLYMGTSCMDGGGYYGYVQLPADVASRHVTNPKYPIIWITKQPSPNAGPALDIGNGYFIQPFQ